MKGAHSLMHSYANINSLLFAVDSYDLLGELKENFDIWKKPKGNDFGSEREMLSLERWR